MGKIRVKTIGIEEDEKEQQKKAKAKAEAKRIEAAKKAGAEKKEEETEDKPEKTDSSPTQQSSKPKEEKKETKTKKEKFTKVKTKSKTYQKVASEIDKNKKYSLTDAVSILPKLQRTKFDETVELHINTNSKGVSGSMTLPHGTGKDRKIEIVDQSSDPKHVEEVIKNIESGKIDFDVLIATPDTMPLLARVARFLGPKGMMPNPKSGTISPKPTDAAKKFEGGQISFKTESKFPIIHLSIGKVSFGDKKLAANAEAVLKAVQEKNIKDITLKSTMSPGIKISI